MRHWTANLLLPGEVKGSKGECTDIVVINVHVRSEPCTVCGVTSATLPLEQSQLATALKDVGCFPFLGLRTVASARSVGRFDMFPSLQARARGDDVMYQAPPREK